MRLTAHQLVAIRRRAPDLAIEEEGPDLWRVSLGRAWFIVRRIHSRALLERGPWQLVRDQDTLRDRSQLRAILREVGVNG